MKILLFNLCNRKETKTRLHSSRMRTARLLPVSPSTHCTGGVSAPGGVCSQGCTCLGDLPGGCTCPGGVPCDLSHHTFDVTRMLPPHQLRPTNSAAAYILLVGHVTCKACWDTTPLPPQWTEFLTQASENITLPQLRCGW